MGKFIPVEPEKWAEMVKAAAASDYWRIEAETDHARWLRTLEENDKLKTEIEQLRKAGDWMAQAAGDVIDDKMGSQAAADAYLLLAIKKWVKAKEGQQS